jgi:hypothetical protein
LHDRKLPAVVRHAAIEMLEELQGNRLHVIKQPSKGGYVRIAVSVNAYWYREFCKRYLRRYGRKDRTMIRRCHVVRALKEIASGKCNTTYAKRLVGLAGAWAVDENRSRKKYRSEPKRQSSEAF